MSFKSHKNCYFFDERKKKLLKLFKGGKKTFPLPPESTFFQELELASTASHFKT